MSNEEENENTSKERILNCRIDLSRQESDGALVSASKKDIDRMISLSNIIKQAGGFEKLSTVARLPNSAYPFFEVQKKLEQSTKGFLNATSAFESIIKPNETNLNRLNFSAIELIQKNSALSQASLAFLTADNFGSLLKSEIIRKQLMGTFTGLLNSYDALNSNILKSEIPAKDISDILSLSSTEMYLSSFFVEYISGIIQNDEELLQSRMGRIDEIAETSSNDEVSLLLSTLDKKNLVKKWKGAKQSFESSNPDKVSHISVSLRELVREVLDLLADESEIKKWNSDFSNEQLYYFDSNDAKKRNPKPTRSARIKYITRNIEIDPLSKFLEFDIKSNIEFIKILNSGTHEGGLNFDEKTLAVMILKTGILIKFLMTVSRFQ